MPILSITESNIFATLRTFLLSILPAGVEVIKGQDNRVGEPEGTDFVVMTPTMRKRLAFNVDTYTNNAFTGSISGTTLTVTEVQAGSLIIGTQVFGVNVAANTVITAFGTGMGGVGTYMVSISQTVASDVLNAGTANAEQYTQISIQLDVHGPSSGDNSQVIATLFWDQDAFQVITTQGFDIAPLYCSDPRQIPFINAEQQYEDRYVIDIELQANPIVQTPIQFADELELGPLGIVNVTAEYPA